MIKLLSPDPAEGGTPQTAAQINQPQTGQVELPPPGDPPAPPPAAKIVVTGGRDERTVELEKELEDARNVIARTEAEKKNREQTICELQDQLQTLKFPNPPAQKKSRGMMESFEAWMNGEEV